VNEERETGEVLERGRKLAAAILAQVQRFYLALGNLEEGKRLDLLQAEFVKWVDQANVEYPDIPALPEFADPRLRPAPPNKNVDQYQLLRRQAALDEVRNTPERWEFHQTKKTAHADTGMWSGTVGI
jgi:hypothetical protein